MTTPAPVPCALAWLARRWPLAFPSAGPLPPLKVGVRAEVLAVAEGEPGAPTPEALGRALAAWCGRGMYLEAIAARRPRVGLGGEPGEVPTPEHAARAARQLADRLARAQARARERTHPAQAPGLVGLDRPVLRLRRAMA